MTTERRRSDAPTEALAEDPPIAEVMTTHLVGITSDAPVSTALGIMASTGVRHLPVLDGRACRGLVVEADLARFLASGQDSPAHLATLLVGRLVRPANPVALPARRSDAARQMAARDVDAVLVTDGGRLVGIVTATDLIRSLAGVRRSPGAPGSPDAHGDRDQGWNRTVEDAT
jgi:CBS domain-containing protein